MFSLLDGSAGVLDGQGGLKLAGADSAMGGEAGRKEKPAEGGGGGEPKSLLSATSEQLEKMIAGTGEALDKGAAGAKDALTRTWDELTGPKAKGLPGALSGEALCVGWPDPGGFASSPALTSPYPHLV